jgi:hypothetical protein
MNIEYQDIEAKVFFCYFVSRILSLVQKQLGTIFQDLHQQGRVVKSILVN